MEQYTAFKSDVNEEFQRVRYNVYDILLAVKATLNTCTNGVTSMQLCIQKADCKKIK